MKALKSHGDHLEGRDRYGMAGDSYLATDQVNDRAEALFVGARRTGWFRWLPETAVRFGLAEYEPHELEALRGEGWHTGVGIGALDAAIVLANAHVTWADICHTKS